MEGCCKRVCVVFLLFFILILGFNKSVLAIEEPDFQTIAVVAAMKKMLNLKDAQVNQVIPLFRDYFKKAQVFKKEMSSEMSDSTKSKIKYLRDDLDSNLEHYLTQEQMSLWKEQLPVKELTFDSKKSAPKIREDVLESSTSGKTRTSGIW